MIADKDGKIDRDFLIDILHQTLQRMRRNLARTSSPEEYWMNQGSIGTLKEVIKMLYD